MMYCARAATNRWADQSANGFSERGSAGSGPALILAFSLWDGRKISTGHQVIDVVEPSGTGSLLRVSWPLLDLGGVRLRLDFLQQAVEVEPPCVHGQFTPRRPRPC